MIKILKITNQIPGFVYAVLILCLFFSEYSYAQQYIEPSQLFSSGENRTGDNLLKAADKAYTAAVTASPAVISITTGSSVNSFDPVEVMDSSYIKIVFDKKMLPAPLADPANWFVNVSKAGEGIEDNEKFYQLSSYSDWNTSFIEVSSDSESVKVYLRGSAKLGDGLGNTGDIHGIAFQGENITDSEGTPYSSQSGLVYYYADVNNNHTAESNEVADGIAPVFKYAKTVWLDNSDSTMSLDEFAVKIVFSENISYGSYSNINNYRLNGIPLDGSEDDGNPLIYDKTDISAIDSIVILKTNFSSNKFISGDDTPLVEVIDSFSDSYGNSVVRRSLIAQDGINPQFSSLSEQKKIRIKNIIHQNITSEGNPNLTDLYQSISSEINDNNKIFYISAGDTLLFTAVVDSFGGTDLSEIKLLFGDNTFTGFSADTASNVYGIKLPIGHILSTFPLYSGSSTNTIKFDVELNESGNAGDNISYGARTFTFIYDTVLPQESVISSDSMLSINPGFVSHQDTFYARNSITFKAVSSNTGDIAVYRYQISASGSPSGTWYDLDIDPPGDANGDNAPGILGVDDNNDGIVDGVDLNNDGIMDAGGLELKDDDNENGTIDEDLFFTTAVNGDGKSIGSGFNINLNMLEDILTVVGAADVKSRIDNIQTVYFRAVPYDYAGNRNLSAAAAIEIKIDNSAESEGLFRTRITSTVPRAYSTGSFSDYPIEASFEWNMDQTSIIPGRFWVEGEISGPDSGSLTYNAETKSVSFRGTDSNGFFPGERIFVSLSDSIMSSTQNRLINHNMSFSGNLRRTGAYFIPADSLKLPETPGTMIPADINRDGYIDIIINYAKLQKIIVLWNNGEGDYSETTELSVNGDPENVQVKDLNRDYFPDIISSNFNKNTISVFLNKGNKQFYNAVDYSTANGPAGFEISDLNGDGWNDLAVTCSGANVISVFQGGAAGTLNFMNNYTTGTSPVKVKLTDFNNDGFSDMVVVNQYSNNISVYKNSGSGSFSETGVYAAGGEPYSIVYGDINRDGFNDLAVGNQYDDTISLFINNGDGTFSAGSTLSTGDVPIDVQAGDVNGDGIPDLVSANFNSNNVTVFTGDGTGAFTSSGLLETKESPVGLKLADYDRDNDLDIIVLNRAAKLIQFYKNSNVEISCTGSINFGEVPVDSSKTLSLSITNTGTVPVTIDSISNSKSLFIPQPGAFSVNPGTTYEFQIIFYPRSAGDFLDTLVLRSSVSDDVNKNVILSGKGIVVVSASINISQDSLVFSETPAGSQSRDSVLIKNNGLAELVVSQISVDAGEFEFSPGLFNLQPGDSSYLYVTFQPQLNQNYSGALQITSNDPVYPVKTVHLSGAGGLEQNPEILLPSSEIDFGDVCLGKSDTIIMNISNTGGKILSIDSVVFSNSLFTSGFTGNMNISGGTYSSLNFVFSPEEAALEQALVYIYSNDSLHNPVSLQLSGKGVDPLNPDIRFSVDTLSFGEVNIGDSSTAVFSITNVGSSVLSITERKTDLSVFYTSNETFNLDPGESKIIEAVFKPRSTMEKNGKLQFTIVDGTVFSAVLPLKGKGIEKAVADLVVNNTNYDFGYVFLGNSADTTITFYNNGSINLTASLVSVSNPVYTTDLSSVTIPPGESESFKIYFTPTKVSYEKCDIQIRSNDPVESIITFSLEGEGIEVYDPTISVSTQNLNFGTIKIDSVYSQNIVINNSGTGVLVIDSLKVSNSNFSVSSSHFEIKTGESYTITVTFSPQSTGELKGNLILFSNDDNNPQTTITLIGYGSQTSGPVLSLSSSSIEFGEIYISESKTINLRIYNYGSEELIISEISAADESFSVSKSTMTLSPFESDSIQVTFSPVSAGEINSTVIFHSNAQNGSEITVQVSGTGIEVFRAIIDVSTDPVSFGIVEVGSSDSISLPIRNVGNDNLIISLIKTYSTVFSASHGYLDIPAGETVYLTVKFSPVQDKTESAQLRLVSNADNLSDLYIYLSGTGKIFEYQDTVTVTRMYSSETGDNVSEKLYEDVRYDFINFTGALEYLNSGSILFPLGTLDENVSFLIKAYEFYKSGKIDLRAFEQRGFLNATEFELSVNGILISPKIPVEIQIPYNDSLAAKLMLPEENLKLAFFDPAGEIDSTGITNLAVDTLNNIIKADIARFGILVVTGKEVFEGTYEPPEIPSEFYLYQNYPNPFNPSTYIKFDIESDMRVSLEIYDILGRKVRHLADRYYVPGTYTVMWDGLNQDGSRCACGVYLYRINTAGRSITKKMTILR